MNALKSGLFGIAMISFSSFDRGLKSAGQYLFPQNNRIF